MVVPASPVPECWSGFVRRAAVGDDARHRRVLSATLAITGAAGGVASIVSTNPLDTALLLPTRIGVALRVNVWLPFTGGVCCGVKTMCRRYSPSWYRWTRDYRQDEH